MVTKSTKGTPVPLAPPPPLNRNSSTKGSPEDLIPSRNLSKEPSTENVPLNFKVPPEFRRELKMEAADRGMSMTSLLLEMYAYWKKHHA